MENIARGCFISRQPCLRRCSARIVSSLSLNHSSLLPPFVSLSSFNFPHFLSSLYQFLGTFFPHPPPPVRQKCQDVLFAHPPHPHPPPPHALSVKPGRPREDEQHCHFGPALREDEAGKVPEEEGGRRRRRHVLSMGRFVERGSEGAREDFQGAHFGCSRTR